MKRIQKFNENWEGSPESNIWNEMFGDNDNSNDVPVEAPIIELKDYTDTQKIKFFDEVYEMSREYLAEKEEDPGRDGDEHWFFEKCIESLNIGNSSKVWKYINSL